MTPGSPRDRLVAAALLLFYERGYNNVGINELLQKAKVFKKTFYTYYPSKDDLGREYVILQTKLICEQAAYIAERSKNHKLFIRNWMKVLRERLTEQYPLGCPIANFANQTHTDRDRFSDVLSECYNQLSDSLHNMLLKYPEFSVLRGEQASEICARLIIYYQGILQVYALNKTVPALGIFRKEMELLEKCFQPGSMVHPAVTKKVQGSRRKLRSPHR